VKILKALVSTITFLFIGLAGTLAIIGVTNLIIRSKNPVMLPSGASVTTDFWDRGYVYGRGTWTMGNAKPAFPIQTSIIKCNKEEKSCLAAQAEVVLGYLLNLEMYSYDITKWDNTTILFRTDNECVEYVYTIDRLNKRLFGTRTKKRDASADCSGLEDKALQLTLVDGFEVWRSLNQEAESKIAPVMWMIIGGLWFLLAFFFWYRRRRTQQTQHVTRITQDQGGA